MKRLAILAMALLLTGCAGDNIYRPKGGEAPAPDGWVDLCNQKPDYPKCKPATN